MRQSDEILDLIGALRTEGACFAVATVVRTLSLTAAKAGAKAVIRADGTIEAGWIGGGCARGAVLRAARAAIADGRPRLVSVQPPDLLEAGGIEAGEDREGIHFEKNLCPSQGSMDIFVEPVLPRPELLVCGATPVAEAIASLAPHFGFHVRITAPDSSAGFGDLPPAERYIVVATQGSGDRAALAASLHANARYVGFVASRRKIAALRAALAAEGFDPAELDALHAPAGLPIDAVTPEEIALSILAEITSIRRRGARPLKTVLF
ncbi:MAG TPA: XdhC family protein [Acetobacteraceae bacterium]|nr:XdhC family protein [Acetobacteraceae bacterium]